MVEEDEGHNQGGSQSVVIVVFLLVLGLGACAALSRHGSKENAPYEKGGPCFFRLCAESGTGVPWKVHSVVDLLSCMQNTCNIVALLMDDRPTLSSRLTHRPSATICTSSSPRRMMVAPMCVPLRD